MESNKVYVDVVVKFTKEGRVLPMELAWEDGQKYEVQKVCDIRRLASLKAGGVGLRYTCMISGRESHLFYEDDNRWFVERK